MTRLDRYLLSRLIVLFLFFTLILTSVFWINIVVRLLEHVLPSFDDIFPLLTYFALYLPDAVTTIMPLAAFASATYLTYRIIANNELAAMQATASFGGIRFMRPYIVFAVLLFIVASFFTHVFKPASHNLTHEYNHRVIDVFNLTNIRTGEYLFPVPGVAIFIEEVGADDEVISSSTGRSIEYFKNVFIQDDRDEAYTYTIFAAKTYLLDVGTQFLAVLIDGHAEILTHATREMTKLDFERYIFRISLENPEPLPRDSSLDHVPTPILVDPGGLDPPLTRDELKRSWLVINERINDSLVVAMIALFGATAVYTIGMMARSRNASILFSVVMVVICYIIGENAISIVEKRDGSWLLNHATSASLAASILITLLLPVRMLQRHGYLETR